MRLDRLAARPAGTRSVQANCWPVTLTRISSALRLLDVVEHDVARRSTSATSMIAGIAVQTTSRRVLPWIGGPSRSSSPGRMRKFTTLNRTMIVTSHEDRDRDDDQDVAERVDRPGLRRRRRREPVDRQARWRCRSPTRSAPMTTIQQDRCALVAPGVLAHAARDPMWCARRTAIRCVRPARRRSAGPGSQRVSQSRGEAAAGGRGADGTRPPLRREAACRAHARGGSARKRRVSRNADGASAVMAPERLRELGGLAVADAVGDLADGQPARGEQLGGALHAHRR